MQADRKPKLSRYWGVWFTVQGLGLRFGFTYWWLVGSRGVYYIGIIKGHVSSSPTHHQQV